MTNPLRGEAELATDAGPLRLVFDVEALVLAETALGETTDQIILSLEAATVDVARVRAMLWAGLQRRHPCPASRASAIMEEVGFSPAKDAVLAGLRGAFGLATEDGDDAHPPRPGRTPGGSTFWSSTRRWAVALIASGGRRRG